MKKYHGKFYIGLQENTTNFKKGVISEWSRQCPFLDLETRGASAHESATDGNRTLSDCDPTKKGTNKKKINQFFFLMFSLSHQCSGLQHCIPALAQAARTPQTGNDQSVRSDFESAILGGYC